MAPFKGFTGNLNKGTSKSFRGFTGGTEKFKKREKARSQYFDNRPDVSKDRLDRRIKQAEGIAAFKRDKTKAVNIVDPVTGKVTGTVTGLTQAITPGGDTVADERIRLANKYGPTFSEIMSDVTYAGGKTLGALGERALSGGIGFLGAMNEVVKYATSKVKDGYNKLTDVQKEIIDNKDKYPLTSSGLPAITAMNNNERLALEAQRDLQKFTFAGDASSSLGVDTNRLDSFVDEPIDTFGTAGPTVDMRKPTIEEMRTIPVTQSGVFPAEEIKEAAIDRFSQEYLDEQKRQLEELNRLRQVEELKPNAPGGTLEDMSIEAQPGEGNFMFPEGYTIPFTDIEVPSLMRKAEDALTDGKGFLTKDDQASVTEFNNPGNLTDVGQAGTTGQTYGNNFAVFPTAQAGIKALENDLALKVNRSNKVEDIIGQYAAGDPNVGNYIDFVKNRVGPTVDQNELDDLRNAVIRFENKPDIAERYLALVADGGLMDKKMYGGIIASKG